MGNWSSKIKKLNHIANEYWTQDLSPDLYHSKSLIVALHCPERFTSVPYCQLVCGVYDWELALEAYLECRTSA